MISYYFVLQGEITNFFYLNLNQILLRHLYRGQIFSIFMIKCLLYNRYVVSYNKNETKKIKKFKSFGPLWMLFLSPLLDINNLFKRTNFYSRKQLFNFSR